MIRFEDALKVSAAFKPSLALTYPDEWLPPGAPFFAMAFFEERE